MGYLILGLIFGCVAGAFLAMGRSIISAPYISRIIGVVGGVIAVILIVVSTAICVPKGYSGLVSVKFGPNLMDGHIVATQGEKGPQAAILPDGWHFGYWPWKYDLEPIPNEDIPQGKIGIVTAKDGKPLTDLEGKDAIFAPEWKSAQDLMDGMKFMTGEGYKGPQLTVLPPGQYRFNPRLFKIEQADVLNVKVGQVAVIKANVGEEYKPEEGEELVVVNGVPIVPKPYRGIWRTALVPNKYYLHTTAYEVTFVSTVKRVYSYTGKSSLGQADRPEQDNSMEVRTKDGFKFPVDVRTSVKISAENAPYVVAMLQNPDTDTNNDGFDILEERAILPSLRSIFRNNAEDKDGLAYVNSRSEVEKDATDKFKTDMEKYKVDVDAVYVADIGLDRTDEGKELLKTQTDKEIAVRQQDTYKEQVKAEEERALKVKAEEAANQQSEKQIAAAQEDIEDSRAKAKIKKAEGDAAYNREQVAVLGGVENYIRLEAIKMGFDAFKEKWSGKFPEVLVVGGGGSGAPGLEALVPMMVKQKAQEVAVTEDTSTPATETEVVRAAPEEQPAQ